MRLRTELAIIEKIQKEFNESDSAEPFMNREYVERANHIIELIKKPFMNLESAEDRAVYDIINSLIEEMQGAEVFVQKHQNDMPPKLQKQLKDWWVLRKI